MRTFFYAIAFLTGGIIFTATTSQAQIRLQVNIGNQPEWGPSGYEHVEYYYLPDIDMYYSVTDSEFIYFDGRTWVHRAELPRRYRNYDLYKSYKVVVNDPNPWAHNDDYHRRYYGYRDRHDQVILRDGRDSRYRASDANEGDRKVEAIRRRIIYKKLKDRQNQNERDRYRDDQRRDRD
jgi:hypothetical protein